jgi:hypothetical protein
MVVGQQAGVSIVTDALIHTGNVSRIYLYYVSEKYVKLAAYCTTCTVAVRPRTAHVQLTLRNNCLVCSDAHPGYPSVTNVVIACCPCRTRRRRLLRN